MLAGATAALVPIASLWGFSVDDALIVARVAAHIAAGFGHRFNTHGPVVDCVTPLGFAYFVAPFAERGVLPAMYFAKWSGAASGVVAGARVGALVAEARGSALRYSVLVVLALSVPFGAWCASGMETGHVVLLATLALSPTPFGALCAGAAAALRPELVPWAVALVFARAFLRGAGSRSALVESSIALAPAAAVAVTRVAIFGHAVPLAFYAKPSDPDLGLRYVAAALLWTGAPVLVLAPRSFARLDSGSRSVVFAAAVHSAALVFAGGDWMAFFRLFVPLLPGLLVVGARVGAVAPPRATLIRLAVAVGTSLTLAVSKGPVARRVLAARLHLIGEARPLLAAAKRPAALDVGWVGAATDADVVDLAGVTDETIARLPGGHTSKRIPPQMLARRNVDALVLLAGRTTRTDSFERPWARAVESRVALQARELNFEVHGTLHLSGTEQEYVVFLAKNAPLNP
jgi:hypothetical protein